MGLARQEAQRFNHDYIGPEHILLGLIQEGSGVAADVLKNLDVELKRIRREVEELVSRGNSMVTMGQIPFTPGARRVLELALEEASNLGHNYIGTEHLLLGLIREPKGVAGQVLRNIKIRIEDAREEVLELLGAEVDEDEIRCTAVPESRRYAEKAVGAVRFDGRDLVIEIQGSAFSTVHLVFRAPAGFRVLDRRDLGEFWPEYSEPNGWLWEVHSGGWMDLERHRPLSSSHRSSAPLREFLVVDDMCVSILCAHPPEFIDPGATAPEA